MVMARGPLEYGDRVANRQTMTDTKKRALKAFAPHLALMAGSTYAVAIVFVPH